MTDDFIECRSKTEFCLTWCNLCNPCNHCTAIRYMETCDIIISEVSYDTIVNMTETLYIVHKTKLCINTSINNCCSVLNSRARHQLPSALRGSKLYSAAAARLTFVQTPPAVVPTMQEHFLVMQPLLLSLLLLSLTRATNAGINQVLCTATDCSL